MTPEGHFPLTVSTSCLYVFCLRIFSDVVGALSAPASLAVWARVKVYLGCVLVRYVQTGRHGDDCHVKEWARQGRTTE